MPQNSRRPASARLLGDGYIGVWVAYEDREHAKRLPGARWDAGLKCWRVPELFVADAQRLIDRLNGGGDTPLTEALAVVFGRIPDELRQPTHRALQKIWHPDAGGNVKATQSLNLAWTQVTS